VIPWDRGALPCRCRRCLHPPKASMLPPKPTLGQEMPWEMGIAAFSVSPSPLAGCIQRTRGRTKSPPRNLDMYIGLKGRVYMMKLRDIVYGISPQNCPPWSKRKNEASPTNHTTPGLKHDAISTTPPAGPEYHAACTHYLSQKSLQVTG
jgi:hypothetical protein